LSESGCQMAPKKNSKRSPGAPPQCQVATAPSNSARGPAADLNAVYNCDLRAAYDEIMRHPVFSGIVEKFGLPAAKYDNKKAQDDIEQKGFYRFDGNVFMIKPTVYDDVPVSRARVTKWMERYRLRAPARPKPKPAHVNQRR
jgi:hypothetical protein